MQLGITRNQPNFSFPNLTSQMVSQANGGITPSQSLAQQISGLSSLGQMQMPTFEPPTAGLNFGTGGLSSLAQGNGNQPESLWGRIDGFVGDNFNNWGDALKTGFAGVETIGKLWSAFQMNKMAKQQFNFSRDMANTNLANQITAFNTALADRARSRAVYEGQSDAERDAYIEANKARDTRQNRG